MSDRLTVCESRESFLSSTQHGRRCYNVLDVWKHSLLALGSTHSCPMFPHEHFAQKARRIRDRETTGAGVKRLLYRLLPPPADSWIMIPTTGQSSRMYAYPQVPRCHNIPLPDCMYKMKPITIGGLTVSASETPAKTGDKKTETPDDRSLQQILCKQQLLLDRIAKLELGINALPIDLSKVEKKPVSQEKKCPFAESCRSVLQRQEKLIQAIDKLAATVQSAEPAKPPDMTTLTKQKIGDVSVFVELGTTPTKLLKFAEWLQKIKRMKVQTRTHIHSSALESKPTINWKDIVTDGIDRRAEFELTMSFVVRKTNSEHPISAFISVDRPVVTSEDEIIRLMADKLSVQFVS